MLSNDTLIINAQRQYLPLTGFSVETARDGEISREEDATTKFSRSMEELRKAQKKLSEMSSSTS